MFEYPGYQILLIHYQNKNFENTRLEFDYLSSTEKLLQFQNLYFDNELIKFDIQKIQTITRKSNEIQIGQLSLNNNEE